jgi:hypothetical protein
MGIHISEKFEAAWRIAGELYSDLTLLINGKSRPGTPHYFTKHKG